MSTDQIIADLTDIAAASTFGEQSRLVEDLRDKLVHDHNVSVFSLNTYTLASVQAEMQPIIVDQWKKKNRLLRLAPLPWASIIAFIIRLALMFFAAKPAALNAVMNANLHEIDPDVLAAVEAAK